MHESRSQPPKSKSDGCAPRAEREIAPAFYRCPAAPTAARRGGRRGAAAAARPPSPRRPSPPTTTAATTAGRAATAGSSTARRRAARSRRRARRRRRRGRRKLWSRGQWSAGWRLAGDRATLPARMRRRVAGVGAGRRAATRAAPSGARRRRGHHRGVAAEDAFAALAGVARCGTEGARGDGASPARRADGAEHSAVTAWAFARHVAVGFNGLGGVRACPHRLRGRGRSPVAHVSRLAACARVRCWGRTASPSYRARGEGVPWRRRAFGRVPADGEGASCSSIQSGAFTGACHR